MRHQGEYRTDIEKLNILLPHWLHHNNDHIHEQENWLNKAEAAGLTGVAAELRRAIDYSKKALRHIEKAAACLQAEKSVPQK